MCEILRGGVWLPWAVSQPVKIISKMSCKGMRDLEEGEAPLKRARPGSPGESAVSAFESPSQRAGVDMKISAPPRAPAPAAPVGSSPLSNERKVGAAPARSGLLAGA